MFFAVLPLGWLSVSQVFAVASLPEAIQIFVGAILALEPPVLRKDG